ncbi:cellulose binding domain-containing protein [Streptosporangium sp. KLBMP 9127]|nr:cellulose-binding domain-containing protein [Streptosporangium sp. KLBMP 9127]
MARRRASRMARVAGVLFGTIVLIATYASPARAMINACEWVKVSSWATGFHADVTLIDDGGGTLDWTVQWTWGDPNARLTNAWNAVVVQPGQSMSAHNQPWNGTIGPGGRVTFGMVVTGTVNDDHGGGLTVNGIWLPC